MIGRCDRGHIHPATTDDIPSLRALEDVTPPKEITKVPSRCFLTARAIDQELTNCPMVFRIRFECPSESTTVNDDVSKPPLASTEESCDNVANSVAPVANDDSNGDILRSAIFRLEAKIGKFEKNMNERGMKDMTKFFVQFKNTVLDDINGKNSLLDEVNSKIHELEKRIADKGTDERIRRLEAKLEEFQKDTSDFTVIEKYIDGGELAIGTTENHLQVREDSLIEVLNEKVSQLQNQIADVVVSDERIRQLEAKIEEFQLNASDFTIVENYVDRSEAVIDATIKCDLEAVHETLKNLQKDVDVARNEINSATYVRIISLEDHLLQLATKMEETKMVSSDAETIKGLRDRVEEVDTGLSEHMMKNAVIVDDIENRLLKFRGQLDAVNDVFRDELQAAKDSMGEEIHEAKNTLNKEVEKTNKDCGFAVQTAMDEFDYEVERLKEDVRYMLEETKDDILDGTVNKLAKRVDKLDEEIKTLGKRGASQNTEEKNLQRPSAMPFSLEPQPSTSVHFSQLFPFGLGSR